MNGITCEEFLLEMITESYLNYMEGGEITFEEVDHSDSCFNEFKNIWILKFKKTWLKVIQILLNVKDILEMHRRVLGHVNPIDAGRMRSTQKALFTSREGLAPKYPNAWETSKIDSHLLKPKWKKSGQMLSLYSPKRSFCGAVHQTSTKYYPTISEYPIRCSYFCRLQNHRNPLASAVNCIKMRRIQQVVDAKGGDVQSRHNTS
uniref:Cullin domain-containing protein n=1 Tax=Heterorhabditis bacteriophora TaxID=37862 RepID=A0A1I7X0B7_HETBA